MTEPLSTWVMRTKAEYPNALDGGYGHYQSGQFLRDPVRAIQHDKDIFFSPADGVVLYQRVISADDAKGLNIKGRSYSLRDVLEDQRISGRALVTGIFMTVYDVHINRIPYSGVLSYRTCSPILSANRPMDPEEDDIMAEHLNALVGDMGGYLRYNARTVNRVYVPEWDYNYYIVQIADDDVDVIAPFNSNQNIWTHQGNRFGMVRWGSQVELVMPLDDRFDFTGLANGVCHVTAGVDHLVRVKRNEEPKTLYASRRLLNTGDIHAWAKEQGFRSVMPENRIHVTLCYSKKPIPWNRVKPDMQEFVKTGGYREIKQFGDAVVLTFSSNTLQKRHQDFMGAGASHDFDSFDPHITITWRGAGVDVSKVVPYIGELVFGPEVFREIKKEFDGKTDIEEVVL